MSAITKKLKEFYEYTGCVPTVRDCDGELLPKYYLIKREGGLKHLLGRAGIEKPKIRSSLISSMIRFYEENDSWPRSRDCQTTDYMRSHTTYVEEFGSWKEGVECARKTFRDSE